MTTLLILMVLGGALGLIIGSFLAAVSVRLPRDEDVVLGRSRCMTCERVLRPWHLVPMFSWLALRGRCGSCGARISSRYIVIELAAGVIGVWAVWHGQGQNGPMMAATAFLGWQLLLIAVVDAENFWLPDILTLPLIGSGLVLNAILQQGVPWSQIIAAAAGFSMLWLLAWVYRRVRGRDGLGGGDPILFAGAGAWVGWSGLPSVLLWACAVGFSVVAARLIVRRKVQATDRLPFGTYLAVGVWLTWLLGPLGTF